MHGDTEPNAQTVCIAVLPFESLSNSREHDYFSSGFVEDLITDLSHFPNLQVISSYTSKKIGIDGQDEMEVARSLAIDYLLKGSLLRQANQIRINTQLLDVSSGGVLWAERYHAPTDTIFDIQDDMVERVVSSLSTQIDKALLTAARKKPLTSLAAYDCWLRGMDYLRQGSPEADRKARHVFNQALEIDASYSRAYAGLSLSYFNDWSCQLWEQWKETERNAYQYALEASRLDDTDHIVQMILGRILLYRKQFDLAEQHIDKSLTLNSNDADCLAQIATSMAFLGKAEKGERLFLKALRLNPYRNLWYYPYGAFTYFVQRQYSRCIELALKGPLTDVWIDLPAFIAAAFAYSGDRSQAAHYLNIFTEAFQKQVTSGRPPRSREIIDWLTMANPFRHDGDTQHMVEGLAHAGLVVDSDCNVPVKRSALRSPAPPSTHSFKKDNDIWELRFDGTTVQLSEVKGFLDLTRLLIQPDKEIHCTELMGSTVSIGDQQLVLDDKARNAYQQRIVQLQEAITEAKDLNDLHRAESLEDELDQLTDHLSKAMGIGGRTRKLDTQVERARAAVTWRIRSAIRKIESAHPALGRHLANAIHTGTFCSYRPETPHRWDVSPA